MSHDAERAQQLLVKITNAAHSIQTAAGMSQSMPGLWIDKLDELESIATGLSNQARHYWNGIGDHPDLQP